MDNSLNILIADDHDLVREGLKLTLDKLPEPTSFMEARSADEVRQTLRDSPDINLVILDLNMPGSHGLGLLTDICNEYPDLSVVVLSATEEPRIMQRAIDRGAAGFIPKSAANCVLVSALKLVLSGGIYIPSAMLDGHHTAIGTARGAQLARHATGPSGLTDRQQDVLLLLASGHSNKAIAKQLGLSEHTIKIHITAILRTLGVSNRTEAAIACREQGLIPQE